PIPGEGGYVRQGGKPVISRLEQARLERIARDGGGLYLEADYLEGDTASLLARVEDKAVSGAAAAQTARFWEERFYLFLLPFIVLVLPWFRRHAAFPVIFLALLIMRPDLAQAQDWRSLFLN